MVSSQKDWIKALNEKVSSLLSDTSIDSLKVQYELVSEGKDKLSYYLSVHDGAACVHEEVVGAGTTCKILSDSVNTALLHMLASIPSEPV